MPFDDRYIDHRIMRMEFDNQQFERRIAKSKKSVEDFKEAMDFDGANRSLQDFAHSANDMFFPDLVNNIFKAKRLMEEFSDSATTTYRTLDFDKPAKSVENLTKALDTNVYENLSYNLERIANKFTGFGEVGEYLVSRIRAAVESTADAVLDFSKSVTFDQIDVGKSKYEQLNKSIMTILANGKYTEEQAYAVMDRLMTYTNETSYSFADMAQQISVFTAAGRGLGETERAMEGIANMTAKAGQGAEGASRAMYTFAKAVGAGYLGYEQWVSLNQSAKIITEDFRKTLVETAVETGDLIEKNGNYYISQRHRAESANMKAAKSAAAAAEVEKKALVEIGSLENTLNQRWLTSDVLMKTFQKYYFEGIDDPNANWDTFAGVAAKAAQRALSLTDAINAMKEATSAGWMTSFRLVWGDLSESMETFTGIANRVIEVLDALSETRNRILAVWEKQGGRKSLIRAILGDYNEDFKQGVVGLIDTIQNAGNVIKKGFYDFFKLFLPSNLRPYWDDEGFREAWFGVKLANITNSISEFFTNLNHFFTEEVMVGGSAKSRIQIIQEIIQGIAAVFKFGYDVVAGFTTLISSIITYLEPSFAAIANFFAEMGLSFYRTAEEAQDGNVIVGFFKSLAEALKPLTDGVNAFVIALTDMLGVLRKQDDENGVTVSVFEAIGKALTFVANVISNIGKPVLQFISTFVDVIKMFLTEGITPDTVGKAGEMLGAAVAAVANGIVSALPDSLDFLRGWIKDLFGLWETDIENNSNSIFTFIRKTVTGLFTNVKAFIGQLANGFSLSDLIHNGFGITSAWNTLREIENHFKKTNIYGVVMAFLGVTAVWTLIRLINQAKVAVRSVGEFVHDLSDSISEGFKIKIATGYDKMYTFFTALEKFALIAAALGMIPLPNLVAGVAAAGLLAWFLSAYTEKMSKLNVKSKGVADIAKNLVMIGTTTLSLVSVAVAVGVLAAALAPLSASPEKMLTGVLGLLGIMAILGAFIAVMPKALGMNFGRSGKELVTFAASMGIIVAAVGGLAIGVGVLALLLTPLTVMGLEGVGAALLGLAGILVSLGAFIYVMSKLNAYSNSSTKISGSGFLGMFSGESNSQSLSVQVKGLAAFAAAIGILVLALTPLAIVQWDGFARIIAGLASILVILGVFIFAISRMKAPKKNKDGTETTTDITAQIKGLAGLAAAIGILVLALTPLANIKWDGFAKIIAGLGSILAIILGFVFFYSLILKGTNKVKGKKGDEKGGNTELSAKISGLVGLAFGIAILVQALLPLAELDWGDLAKIGAGLGGILLVLGLFMYFVGKVSKSSTSLNLNKGGGLLGAFSGGFEKNTQGQVKGVLAVAIGIALLVKALMPLAKLKWDELGVMVAGMAAIMIGIGIFLAGVQALDISLKKGGAVFITLTGLVLALLAFSFALNEVKDIKPEVITSFGVSMGIVLMAMAGAITLLGNIGIGAAVKGILVLAVGIAAIVGVISLLIPLILDNIGSGLANAGGKMTMAASTISDFVTKLNGVSDSEMGHAKGILEQLKAIVQAAAGFGGYSQSIDRFTTTIYDLGTGLRIFAGHVKELTVSGTPNAVMLIQSLVDCAPGLERVAKINLDDFTSSLTAMGGAFKIYKLSTDGVDALEEDTPDIEKVIGILKDLSTGLVESGGFAIPEDLPDEKALGLFGAQLAALATAMVDFEEAGSKLGDGTQKALDCIEFLSDIKAKLTLVGSVKEIVSAFTGTDVTADELTTFGKNIEQLGLSLAKFADSTTVVDKATGETKSLSFDTPIKALQDFAKIQDEMPDLPGLFGWLTGQKKSLTDLGGEIENVGTALADFSKKATEAVGTPQKQTDIANAKTAIDGLVDFITEITGKMPIIGGLKEVWDDWWSGHKMTMTELGNNIGDLGGGLARFGEAVSGKFTSTTDIDNAVNLIGSYMSLLETLSHIGENYTLGSNIGTVVEDLLQFLMMMTDGIDTDVFNKEKRLSAVDSMVNLMVAISSKVKQLGGVDGQAIASFKDLAIALSGLSGINAKVDFSEVGKNIAGSVALGIQTYESVVTRAAIHMAVEAYNAAMKAIKAGSPSRLFMDFGSFIDQGAAIGIGNNVGLVVSAMDGMTDSAVESAHTLIAEVTRAMAEGTNAEPVITPVLDLSDVQSGMKTLTGQRYSLNAGVAVARVSETAGNPAPANQNGTDLGGIYARMDQLGEQIVSLGDRIKEMRMVFDTGAIAGAVTDAIDINLGRRKFYAGRRNL